MKLSLLSSFLLLSFSISYAEPAGRKPAPPKKKTAPWFSELTKTAPSKNLNLRPVQLNFSLGWKNRLNAGAFSVVVQEDGSAQNLVGKATGKTTGLARALWPYDMNATSTIGKSDLRSRNFAMTEKVRSKSASYKIDFEPTRQITQVTETNKKKNGGKPTTKKYNFPYDFGRDLLSSVFYVRSQPLNHGDKVTVLVSPSQKTYLARFQVTGRETRTVAKKNYQAIRLNLQISKVRHDLSLETYTKVKKITLWVTDDEYRLPLELQSDLFVGSVTARLDSYKWLR